MSSKDFSLSKRALNLGLVISSVFFLMAGCSLPLGEKPPETLPPETGFGDSTKCLDIVVPNFERFVSGEASNGQVIATWDCVASVVTLFQDSVRGRFEDRFTDRELANFVERNFLTGKTVNQSTMTEVFRVKQLLVGGAVNYISRTEMGLFISVIRQIRDIAVRLNPYMKVYSFNWKIQGYSTLDNDVKYFESANLELQGAAKALAAIIEKNGQTYRLDSFVDLMKEMSQYSSTPWAWMKNLEEAMPLVKKLKKTLTGGDASEILPVEWRRFCLLGGRGFVQYLRYFYFIKSVDSIGSGPELVYITRSIDDLFSYLGDMVDGKPEKNLTRAELLEILQALGKLAPDFRISDELLVEAMKFKVLFFGGRIDLFEKADFERARAKLEAFRTLTEKFLSYANVYGLSWNVSESSPEDAMTYFKASEDNLVEFGKRFGENLETGYDLNDLIRLALAYDDLYPRIEGKKGLAKLAEEFVPVLISYKNILFSDQGSVIGKSTTFEGQVRPKEAQEQWSNFLMNGASVYSRFTYYYYFLRKQELIHEQGLGYLGQLVKDSAFYLESIIKRKPANPVQQISFAEFSKLWNALKGAGLFPEKISVKSIDGVTKMVMQKLLIDPKKRLAGELPGGLTLAGVDQLKSEFSVWMENQKFVDVMYFGVPLTQGKPGSAILSDLDKATATDGLNEMKLVYNTPVALSFDALGRLYLGKPEAPYLRDTADLINVVRSLARLVIRSYAMDEKRFNSLTGSVTLAEAQSLFADVQALVVELGVLDPRNVNFMENRFRDGNLFTAWANGDDFLDFKEINNLALMVWSGITVDSNLYKNLEKVCAINKPGDLKDDWTVKMDCVLEQYKRDLPEQFAAMPEFTKFMYQLGSDHYAEFFTNLVKAAGYKPVPDGTVRVGDLALFPHITQYVENIFQKYDVNRDGFLDTAESMKAYPTFKNILKVAAGGKLKSDAQLKALFAWLLKYQKAPEKIPEFIKFLVWWMPKGEKGWGVRADREALAKILGFIADAFDKASKNKVVVPDVPPRDDGSGDVGDGEDPNDIEELRRLFCDRQSPQYNRARCRQLDRP